MLCIAAGGSWPLQRVSDEVGGLESTLCPRCKEAPETQFHRCWACPENVRSPAFEASECLVAEAYSQH
eukprot:3992842-Pyramimonas_sp.AAC.1